MSSQCGPSRLPAHWLSTDENGCSDIGADIGFENGDLARGSGLESAVLMQLLTDRRGDSQNGWWGNQFQPFEIGSQLWRLRERPGVTKTDLIDAERYVREAIDPLIDQGLAHRYEVEVSIEDRELKITLTFFDAGGERLYFNSLNWVF